MQRDHPGEKLLACIHFPAAGAQKAKSAVHIPFERVEKSLCKKHAQRERKATNAAAQRRPFNRSPLDRQWELSKGHKRIRAAERKKGMKSRVCGHAGSQNTHCVCVPSSRRTFSAPTTCHAPCRSKAAKNLGAKNDNF
jgi:hypothetical protein